MYATTPSSKSFLVIPANVIPANMASKGIKKGWQIPNVF
jgi:hypothetical protein